MERNPKELGINDNWGIETWDRREWKMIENKALHCCVARVHK